MDRIQEIKELFQGKNICVLGYGLEGKSTLAWLRKYFKQDIKSLTIADQNPATLHGENLKACDCTLKYGFDYLAGLDSYDLIIKSPGINLYKEGVIIPRGKIISQSDLFLRSFGSQCIGITGTKGKSTTSKLLYEMLRQSGRDVQLVGNIGKPPLDFWADIHQDTQIVFELSSHQLEYIHRGPSIALLLNLFQEHLDHYRDFRHYQLSKFNITARQKDNDVLITNAEDERIRKLLLESDAGRRIRYFAMNKAVKNGMYRKEEKLIISSEGEEQVFMKIDDVQHLSGRHNLLNVMAASLAALELGCPVDNLKKTIVTFRRLEHRMEFVGKFNDICFYNDAIATIPEATMAAVETLRNVHTLILGGFDRGVDYSDLCRFLLKPELENLVFMGEAGIRIYHLMDAEKMSTEKNLLLSDDLQEAVDFAFKHTAAGRSCLLSPAAASYDKFENYDEKGKKFKEIVRRM